MTLAGQYNTQHICLVALTFTGSLSILSTCKHMHLTGYIKYLYMFLYTYNVHVYELYMYMHTYMCTCVYPCKVTKYVYMYDYTSTTKPDNLHWKLHFDWKD